MNKDESVWEANSESQRKATAHKLRCRKLPPLYREEAEKLVPEFLASRRVTQCPAAYLTPVR
jgi:hypothetical protein